MEKTLSSKSSTSKIVIYALPRLGTSILLGIESWAIFTLYTLAYGVPPFLVGFAIAMGYLSVAASQFLLGWISDAKYTKIGRRKPYIIVITPILVISFVFLLMPALFISDFSDKYSLFLWLLQWIIIFRLAYGVTTPYQCGIAEQFKVNERPKVSQFQNTFNFIGNGIMALFTLLILTNVFDKLKKSPNIIPSELLIPVLIFAILTLALFYFVVIFMPTEPKFEIKSNLTNNLKTILKNRNFLLVTLMQGITGIALSMLTAIMLTYAEVVLNLGGFDYIIIAVFLLLGVFIFLYIWRKLIGKKGKKQTLLYIFLFGIITLPITLLVLVIPMNLYILFGIVFIIIIAAILGGWYLFPYVMYADLAEDDEKSTGELKAGIFTGFPSIILNLFQALGIFVLGIVVSLPNIAIGRLSYSIGLILWGPICSLVLIISYLYTRKYVVLDFEWENTIK